MVDLRQRKANMIFVNSIQYGMKQSTVSLLTLLMAPVDPLTDLSLSLTVISPACS